MKEVTKVANQLRQVKRDLSQAHRESRFDDARNLEVEKTMLRWVMNQLQPKEVAYMPGYMIGK
jgi:hypothetical protein